MAGPDIVDPIPSDDLKSAGTVTTYPYEWTGSTLTKHTELPWLGTAVFLTAGELAKWRARYDTLVAAGCRNAKAWLLCLSTDPLGTAYRAQG